MLVCVPTACHQVKGNNPIGLTALALHTGCKQGKELCLEHIALPGFCPNAFTPKLGYNQHSSLGEELQCPSNLLPVPNRFGVMIRKKGVKTSGQSWEFLLSLTAVIYCHCYQ